MPEVERITSSTVRYLTHHILSEALLESADNCEDIESEVLYPFRDEFDRDIVRVSTDDIDHCRSLDSLYLFTEIFCDILEVLSAFFFIECITTS